MTDLQTRAEDANAAVTKAAETALTALRDVAASALDHLTGDTAEDDAAEEAEEALDDEDDSDDEADDEEAAEEITEETDEDGDSEHSAD